MKPPTHEEIQRAHDGITADGPGADITTELSECLLDDPILRDKLERFHSAFRWLNMASSTECKAFIGACIIAGLNMGIRIGEARK